MAHAETTCFLAAGALGCAAIAVILSAIILGFVVPMSDHIKTLQKTLDTDADALAGIKQDLVGVKSEQQQLERFLCYFYGFPDETCFGFIDAVRVETNQELPVDVQYDKPNYKTNNGNADNFKQEASRNQVVQGKLKPKAQTQTKQLVVASDEVVASDSDDFAIIGQYMSAYLTDRMTSCEDSCNERSFQAKKCVRTCKCCAMESFCVNGVSEDIELTRSDAETLNIKCTNVFNKCVMTADDCDFFSDEASIAK
jgi:hypothetical protein